MATKTTMRGATVVEYNKPLVIRDDLPILKPGANQILVKNSCCSLCMSDISGIQGHVGGALPYCPGHEPVGTVAELGEGVRGFAVGDRVGFMPASNTCLDCSECLSGQHRFCSGKTAVGFNGMQGGFTEYCVADPLSTVKIPDGLPDESAAPLLCAGVTAYGALKKVSQFQTGGTLLNIVGSGGVGHLAIMYAKAMGYRVHAFDIANDKLQLAKDSGAEEVFNSMTGDAATFEKTLCTVVVSGAAPAYDLAFKITAKHGKVIAIGAPNGPVAVNILNMILNDLSLIATNQGTKDDLSKSLTLAASAGIKPVYQLRDISQINEGVEDMMKGKVNGRLVYKF
ncbi:alcohol dehydrogenase [Eremomyces bilateralis CBS 781.70]|uniref:Alcohol dehydrogenase n=1 Tax=Eremomyces bilateralis CBS 781.70 TaxID=1392243 RepID=A0A6G1G4C4_9PEZI|nr:alcohol dehydrogenase [Eremomyces bilateralis CBS 781.70]KAF1812766.1 alcohol dehydrogenase [Eremomyces bilateralis CBS 781.70]